MQLLLRRSALFAAFAFAFFAHAQPVPQPSNGRAFEEAIVPRVYITLPADTLNWIMQNVTSDKEWHADFVHMHYGQADTVRDVGFRLRGNTSRYSGKKSFKISFNSFTPGHRWEGLKDLNLNGEHNDPSVSRARIGWHLFQDMGLPAARSSHVRLYINGDYMGLYANIEQINDDFVERRYGGKAGNLYKCLWPATLTYLSNDPNNYKFTSGGRRAYDLKTNTTADDYSDLANFIQVLNQTPLADLPCALESVFDAGVRRCVASRSDVSRQRVGTCTRWCRDRREDGYAGCRSFGQSARGSHRR